MQWLKNEFLPYLDDWEKSVRERKGFTDAQKKRMLLSDQTILDLRMTGKYTELMKLCYYSVHSSRSFIVHWINRVPVLPS